MKNGVTVGTRYRNSILPKKLWILIMCPSGDNQACLVDSESGEALTYFIDVKDWKSISPIEWGLICNGCPEYFYLNREGDIRFESPLEKLNKSDCISLIDQLISRLNSIGVESNVNQRTSSILNNAGIEITPELHKYLITR